jgi:flagellar assembly protein FliH
MKHMGKLAETVKHTDRPQRANAGVFRGVVMGPQVRTLLRPLSERLETNSTAPDETRVPPTENLSPPSTDPAEGRSSKSGYEEGLRIGRAEGKVQGEAQGREEGFLAGLEQGRLSLAQEAAVAQEHRRASEQALAERLDGLDSLLAALPPAFDKRMLELDDDLLALCFEAVSRIVGDAAASQSGVRAIVSQAMAGARLKSAATIHVNPRDMAFLEGAETIASLVGAHRRVAWRADPAVELGGCLIASSEGSLDARLESQMSELAQIFSSARKEQPR